MSCARLVEAIADRMADVGLRLHPDKTKIVYCKDRLRKLRLLTIHLITRCRSRPRQQN